MDKQKRKTTRMIDEEKKEWAADKKKGVEEVGELRRKVDEALSSLKSGGGDEGEGIVEETIEEKMEVEEDPGAFGDVAERATVVAIGGGEYGDDAVEY